MTLGKHFDFNHCQPRWNDAWKKAGLFTPDSGSKKEAFVITLPPPNVTGILHVGHVLGDSVQDMLIRWKRMQGYNTLYVPGSDHAGIATQKVVESDLDRRGIQREDMSREKFLEYAWKWKDHHHERIVEQLKNLGCSLDWTREAFTLDGPRSCAVRHVFVSLYEKGLIYEGNYIVNWCPSCQTAISDEEVTHEERDSYLYHIRYPMKDGSHIVVATTRPETMLGDTAVAVSPKDKAKKKLVGKTVDLPLVGRELRVIADDAVDPEFGTGFVKVTPAHDPNDFEMGKRHELPHVVVIDRMGRMTDAAGAAYAGLDRFKAREKVLADLKKEGLLEKEEPYRHSVGTHDRCGTVIEPLVSTEWFVKMKPLAEPAIAAVDSGEVDFYPPRWRNVYLNWMNNIRDWCISMDLWWGHRIPVWTCPDGHRTVSEEDPSECADCGKKEITQDERVLDTWFSSWLWTFTPLGWPEKTKDLKTFHPTSVLVTGSEIIFFWVARMMMASLEFLGEVPFRHVFLTGIVRDGTGRKMSKSLGNSPDPLDLIERYGTDSLRFTLVMLSPPGKDVFFAEEKLELGRNFVNKIWQASRMILGAYEKDGAALLGDGKSSGTLGRVWGGCYGKSLAFKPDLNWEDRWILSALNQCAVDVDEKMTQWRLNEAVGRLYDFFWSEFCDWYLELSKRRLYDSGDKRTVIAVLLFVLGESLKMLHPIIPYATEELWSALPMTEGFLLESAYPSCRKELADEKADERMTLFKGLVTSARNIRAQYRINPSTQIELWIKTPPGDPMNIEGMTEGIRQLARADRIEHGPKIVKKKGCASSPLGTHEVIIPLAGILDITAEIVRLQKEIEKLSSEIGVVGKKLANENFVKKARAEVVDRVRAREQTLQAELARIEESLDLIRREV